MQKERKHMPRKPKRSCRYQGCPNLCEGVYCEEHKKVMNQQYDKHHRSSDYGRAWKEIRDKYVREHPLCECCFANGVAVPVDEVHHKTPLKHGGTHEKRNLISLCRSCHGKVHAENGDRRMRD